MSSPKDKRDEEEANRLKELFETKSILPALLWCAPKDSERHQFTATKAYMISPEEAFVICPVHGQIVEVILKPEKQEGKETIQ